MSKRKVVLINVAGIILVVIVIAFISLLSIRSEFTKYLDIKYTDLSFKVSFTKIDIIYGNYYATVTCLNDGISFPISKGFKTENINENYIQYKSTSQYNSKIKSIFEGSAIQKSIKNVTGSSKMPFDENVSYEQVNIAFISDTDQIADVKEVLKILKENSIYAEQVIFTYEKDKGVYQLWLSSNDYTLTEKEIELQVKRIK